MPHDFHTGHRSIRSGGAWVLSAGVCLVLAGGCGRGEDGSASRRREQGPVPVNVAPIMQGPIEDLRTFSGTLEATSRLDVAPKTSGRIESLTVDLADVVTRGQVVAKLDDDEYRQAVVQAEADLLVAKANSAEAESALEIAERDLQRIQTLQERGVASEANLDTARANYLSRQSALQVNKARVARGEAALETAKIRLGYTTITAGWAAGDAERVVAEMHVEEGDTVAANTPFLSIVELNPLRAVIHVTEREYGRLAPGQPAVLATDAWPREEFAAEIVRVAPMFRESTRQARVEMRVSNADHRLKPGMFIRAVVVLDRAENAVQVPAMALTTRSDRNGVFLLSPDGTSAIWREVQTGLREGDLVQILGEPLNGRVVTLGQHLLDDGSPVIVVDADGGSSPDPGPDS